MYILKRSKQSQMANGTSIIPCTPWFKVEAAVLKNEQCLAFGTFLLPSITPISAIANYKVQQKSLTGLRRVVRHHHATNQYFNLPAAVALANDNAIVEIGGICKALPEPINTTAAGYSTGLSSFELALHRSGYNKTSPRGFPSCSSSSTEPECWPNARMVSSSAGPPVTLDNLHPPTESGQGTSMRSQQPSINDLAQIDPAIIANPVQRRLGLPQIPSPADRETFEALLEVSIDKSKGSRPTKTSKVTQLSEELPTTSSIASQGKICPDSNAIREVGHPCPPSPIQASRETKDLDHSLTFAMTNGSYEAKMMHSPSLVQEEKFLSALSRAEIFRVGHLPEHMSLFQTLVDDRGSQSRSEALDWLNIDRCHCPGLDTEIEELDLSRPQYRTPRAGNFRADLINCELSTLAAETEAGKATVDDSLDTASHNSIKPKVELAGKAMVIGEEAKRAVSTREDDPCTSSSRSGPTTDEVEETKADGKTSLVTPPVSDMEADEDPVHRILDDSRRAGGSSYTIRSAMKDAIFRKNIWRSDPKVEKKETRATFPGDSIETAKAGPHPLSQLGDGPTNMTQESRKRGAAQKKVACPKQLTDTARPCQSKALMALVDVAVLIKDLDIPGRAEGNRARFMWIPHERFNAVEVQVSKSGSGAEVIESELDAEDPFTAEAGVYTSHTRCELAVAHAGRMLQARLG